MAKITWSFRNHSNLLEPFLLLLLLLMLKTVVLLNIYCIFCGNHDKYFFRICLDEMQGQRNVLVLSRQITRPTALMQHFISTVAKPKT